MDINYLIADKKRSPEGLLAGDAEFSAQLKDVPIRLWVSWLDPHITHGELMICVGHLASSLEGRRQYHRQIIQHVLRSLDAIRQYVVDQVGIGQIPSHQITWIFDPTMVYWMKKERIILENPTSTPDPERRLMTDLHCKNEREEKFIIKSISDYSVH